MNRVGEALLVEAGKPDELARVGVIPEHRDGPGDGRRVNGQGREPALKVAQHIPRAQADDHVGVSRRRRDAALGQLAQQRPEVERVTSRRDGAGLNERTVRRTSQAGRDERPDPIRRQRSQVQQRSRVIGELAQQRVVGAGLTWAERNKQE